MTHHEPSAPRGNDRGIPVQLRVLLTIMVLGILGLAAKIFGIL